MSLSEVRGVCMYIYYICITQRKNPLYARKDLIRGSHVEVCNAIVQPRTQRCYLPLHKALKTEGIKSGFALLFPNLLQFSASLGKMSVIYKKHSTSVQQ